MRQAPAAAVAALARELALPEALAATLAHRGHLEPRAAERHLGASAMGLHDPRLLPGMAAATARLARALERGESILVHGDYDVDGVTGTALLVRLLRVLGARVHWHIPNRLTDGYSFGPHSLERARAVEASVVISVDNGTSAFEVIERLAQAGVDTIVTDHHEPPSAGGRASALPPAVAIVNPKLADSTYPWRELCGGAVAFKLAWGLCQELSGSQRVRPELKAFLDDALAYVAIATVCDVVPLLDENRILARAGLRALSATRHAGLRALVRAAGADGRALCAEDIGFGIGPRLNAAGRLGSAARAVELLLCDEPLRANALAGELEELNQRRRAIETEVLEPARAQAREYGDAQEHPVLVLAGQGWHQGVVGIVAARIAEEFGRPALVIGLDGDTGRGSARTVGDFDLLAALDGGREHMIKHGGHAQAAGCELLSARVPALRAAVCERARELRGAARAQSGARRALELDGELPLSLLTPDFMRQLERLEPFGPGNAAPILLVRNLRLAEPARALGAGGAHLALRVREGERALKAMAFKQGARAAELAGASFGEQRVHLAYTPRWSTYRGQTQLELLVHALCVGAEPVLGAAATPLPAAS